MKNNVLNLFKSLIISILIVNFDKAILDKDINNKDYKLVKIYDYVCEKYESELQYSCQRFSNNNRPKFTDQEIMAIYLFVMQHMGIFTKKRIYQFARDYLMGWFPGLGSYQAFNNRVNRLSGAMGALMEGLFVEFAPEDCSSEISLLDSMPIITSSGKRPNRVAPGMADKGYCPTKGMYYHGMKLHALGFWRKGGMPHPERIIFTPASVNDLSLYKEAWSEIPGRTFFGDKIYHDHDFFRDIKDRYNSEMLTPVKAVKGMPDVLRNFDRAANDLYSRAVSRMRQPIESLFNWLIEKADIQKASKVRSTGGLILHAYGRLAAAFIVLIF